MDLSAAQRAAVECDSSSICVVAGPGSGKTRVLIERFAWLVEQRGIDPRRILAITFTEKAACTPVRLLTGIAREDRDRMALDHRCVLRADLGRTRDRSRPASRFLSV